MQHLDAHVPACYAVQLLMSTQCKINIAIEPWHRRDETWACARSNCVGGVAI